MKKLTLSKETIVNLTSSDLEKVAGGGTRVCITNSVSHPGCICPIPPNDSLCICT